MWRKLQPHRLLLAMIAVFSSAAAAPAPTVSLAVDGMLNLFEHKSVVALGDAHGLAQEEDFYSALIRDPRFAQQVGNVVMELGGAAAQSIIDRYVNGETVSFTELRRVWTDTAGAFAPGERVPLGIVNVYATVRAVNLKLPPEQRIKVWLGDPKIDWSNIHSVQDLRPLLRMRDDNMFQILDEQILGKRKKALLIVGGSHLFGPHGPGRLGSKISAAYPGSLAVVAPFIGYAQPECNTRFLAGAKRWPTPSVLAPVAGTSLESQLRLPGCNFIPRERLERMKKMAAAAPQGAQPPGFGDSVNSVPPPADGPTPLGPAAPGAAPAQHPTAPASRPPFFPSPSEAIAAETNILSGIKSDAILYLGPPATLTESPLDPSLYLDPEYFHEIDRRTRCCMPYGQPLDWEQILEQSSAAPQQYQER